MSARLDGKVVLITGAASSIGAATVDLVRERGGTAVATDKAAGTDYLLDVTEPDQWDKVIASVVARYGRIDGLVFNAGSGDAGSIVDLDVAEFRALTRMIVEGAFIGIQKVVAQMRVQNSPAQGAIVITSSIAGSVAFPGTAAYGAVNAAISNMAKAIGVELGRKGDFIRVNAVAPSPVRAPLLSGVIEAEDVAETIIFLLSDDASFMTATINPIGSGWQLS